MNSTTFFIITLLFGWCGAHKFIQKKYGMGLLYLFTFGLFTFGWAVDCIRALLPVLRHKKEAPAASSQHDTIVDQLCLSLDPEFVSFVLPMIKAGLSWNRIEQACRSSFPDSECEDLPLRIRYVESYYSNYTEIASLKECGASKYRIISMPDAELCDICKKFKGRTFPVSSARIGYNCPPFHLGCRCTTVIEE